MIKGFTDKALEEKMAKNIVDRCDSDKVYGASLDASRHGVCKTSCNGTPSSDTKTRKTVQSTRSPKGPELTDALETRSPCRTRQQVMPKHERDHQQIRHARERTEAGMTRRAKRHVLCRRGHPRLLDETPC